MEYYEGALELLGWYDVMVLYGCFYKWGGVLFVAVLILRALPSIVYVKARFFGDSHTPSMATVHVTPDT